ncbi:MAG: hypothetical protein KA314_09515 [Chloroflexi bacterium]|nr:hypothetical protein [Chloroflexota bacterium]MBP8056069.1 hypothetical protein [Chloroflexota bacterium]
MERLYVFLIENRIGIYIFCALGLFWFISSLIRARNMLRGAIFSIERENAIRLQNTALIVVFVLLAVIGMVIYVNTAIRPTLAPELLIPPTFTPDIFATPLSSPTPLSTAPSQGPTDTPFFVATATLPPGIGPVTGGAVQTRPPRTPTTVTGTAPGETPTTPTDAAATTLAGCGSGLNITDPTPGSFISGTVTIVGTANIPDFFFYKLEIAGPETGGVWASLLSAVVQETVNNGSLGQANLAGWEPGEYNIRLTVVDQSSNDFGVCAVSVTLTTP